MYKLALGITAINRFLFDAAKWSVVAIAALMLYEVISRYSFSAPTSWAPELATLLFGPFFLLGGPYLLHSGGHVSVDLVTARLQGTTKKGFKVVEIFLAVAFGGILFWFAFPLAVDSFNYRETSFTSWNPQIWPSKAALPLAMALLIMQAFAELIFAFLEVEAK